MEHHDRLLGIGELAERTGVAPETLRAWERRYGLLRPHRTDGGHRRYAQADLARVLNVLRLRRSGLPTSLAAAHVSASSSLIASPPSRTPATDVDELRQRLWRAAEALDAGAIRAALQDAGRVLTVADLLDEVIVPTLWRLGDEWRKGPRHVAREHLASTVLRSWLLSRLEEMSDPDGATVVVACPDGELHDLGAVMAALALAEAGWRPVVLGASTPWASTATVIAELRAPLVLIGVTRRPAALRLLATWRRPHDSIVMLGGPALTPDDIVGMDRVVLHQGSYRRLAAAADAALR